MSSKAPREKNAEEELMDRSLTNVRALVDKIQAEERAQQRTHRWVLVSLAVVTIAAVGIAAFVLLK